MRIIISERAKSHMLCHDEEFFMGWERTLQVLQEKGVFNQLQEDKEVLSLNMEEPIGFCNLVETTGEDDIIYAKRLERELYTRFVRGREKSPTSNILVVLRKNQEEQDAYDFITMYPGTNSEKEPEDCNIESKEELQRSLTFWTRYALIYNEEIIEPGSEKTYCPYQNLFYVFD